MNIDTPAFLTRGKKQVPRIEPVIITDNREQVMGTLEEDLRNAAPGQPTPEEQTNEDYAPREDRIASKILTDEDDLKRRVCKTIEDVTGTVLRNIDERRKQLDTFEKDVLNSSAAAKIALEQHLTIAASILVASEHIKKQVEDHRAQVIKAMPGNAS